MDRQQFQQHILATAESFNLDDPEFLRLHPEYAAGQAILRMHKKTAHLRCALIVWPDGTRMMIGYPRHEPGPFEHDVLRGYYLAQTHGRVFFGTALAWKDQAASNTKEAE